MGVNEAMPFFGPAFNAQSSCCKRDVSLNHRLTFDFLASLSWPDGICTIDITSLYLLCSVSLWADNKFESLSSGIGMTASLCSMVLPELVFGMKFFSGKCHAANCFFFFVVISFPSVSLENSSLGLLYAWRVSREVYPWFYHSHLCLFMPCKCEWHLWKI